MKKLPLHTKIVIGMAVGIGAGIIVRNTVADEKTIETICSYVQPIGKIFLRMVFMMVIPLILTALTLGIADLGDMRKLGRIGFRMLKYTLVVSTISVMIGIAAVQIFQPGKGLDKTSQAYLVKKYKSETQTVEANAGKAKSIGDVVSNIIPQNPIEDMARAFDPEYKGGGLLSVMFFALIFGVALSAIPPEKAAPVKAFLEGVYEVVMKVIGYAMKLAPYGVAAMLFVLTANMGTAILAVLLKYVLVVIGALALHLFGTYSIILKYFAKTNPIHFFKKMDEVMITAFSTSSSNATLPIAIKDTHEKLNIPRDITNFVLTIGSTANQNGTALYEGITVLFLAQCFDVHLGMFDQILVVLMCILAGVGTAGVPGGSLPVIMLILVSIKVPGESIALIYGVDRILDMSRTVLNVTGDVTAAVYINAREGKNRQSAVGS